MKLYLYCSLFALLFLVSCRSDKVYSEWSLQNRESGEYLGEKQGSFCFAAEPSGDEYLWIIESTSGEEFLIKNKKSGNYLQLDSEGAVCAAPGGQETENMKWKYGGFDFVTQKNCGWYTLENGAAETERHLARRADGIVMDDSDRVKDYRSHWNIVRETGTELSFVLTPDKVTDASFLGTREAVALDAGYLETTVLDIVENNGIKILILDTSAACHMPDVLEMPYRPPLMDSGEPGEKKYTYRLSSCTCLAGDVIGDYSFDREIKTGDRLCFCDMAIYSMVKNNTFNGMPLPDIAVMDENNDCKVIRRFEYEDFKCRLS